MQVTVLKTFVAIGPNGMIVGNAGDVGLEIPDELFAALEAEGNVAAEHGWAAPVSPVDGILSNSAKQIAEMLPAMEITDLEALLAAERAGKARKGVIADIESALAAAKADPDAANEPVPGDDDAAVIDEAPTE
jgi:hypothetical protein